jgi:hypothetical protein
LPVSSYHLKAKTAPKPCHVYLTFGTNASTTVIVHYHSSKQFNSPVVLFSADNSLSLQATAVGIKMDLEIKRWVYYAELTGLAPDTSYNFIAGDAGDPDSFSIGKKFWTAPVDGDTKFISGGDLGLSSRTAKLVKAAAASNPLYMALGGDLAYANAMKSCYPRWDAFLSMYEENAVSSTGHTIPIVAAVGNHEAGGFAQPLNHLPFYTRYFVQESLNGRQPQDLPTYHVKYISRQVLISLDSNVIVSPEKQVDWLKTTLSAAPANSFKTAIYHAPAYPSVRAFSDEESKIVRDHFAPVFDSNALAVSFENHDHAYKRTHRLKAGVADPTGTLYIGDGAMGVSSRIPATQTTIPVDRPYLAQLQGRSFYLVVTVGSADYDIAAIDDGSVTFDSVTHQYI